MGQKRTKGRVKKKSIKAPSHSSMGSKRKLSRMGKKRKKDRSGLDHTFIGRSACVKRLQITLKDFRRLCILKGVYPREPRGRAPKNRKGQVYYHVKDVRAIAHEPVLHKFREFRAFMKKVRRAAGRNEKDDAARMDRNAPTYTLHHLVRERYPRFVDALSDLDDALTLVHLFAALPSEGRIRSRVTRKARALSASWGAYCASTSSITKNFVSVKGVYLEAYVKGCAVRWIVPHAFTQHMPKDVDFRVMLTFFEFYETLLGFVLYKLYGDAGVRYPLSVSDSERAGASTLLAANLRALSREVGGGRGTVSDAVGRAAEEARGGDGGGGGGGGGDGNGDGGGEKKKKKLTKKKGRELMESVDAALAAVDGDDDDSDDDDDDDATDDEEGNVDVAAPLKAALESMAEEGSSSALVAASSSSSSAPGAKLDDEAARRRRLFSGLTFFVSREVPRGYVELVCLSYGGRVGWEGDDSPVSVRDPSVTHHIVDRPTLPPSYGSLPGGREYVQPQWVLDSANFRFLLPCGRYGVGARLPPHLSPWVDHEEEGYRPAYAEEVERLINGEAMPDADEEEKEGEGEREREGEEAAKRAREERGGSSVPDSDGDTAEEEEAGDAEMGAGTGTGGGEGEDGEDEPADGGSSDGGSDSEGEEEEEEDDDEAKAERAAKRKRAEDDEAHRLAKMMMGRKAKRLYGRMQHGLEETRDRADKLHRRRREIEGGKKKGKDGKTVLKQRVERLREERREVERSYAHTGGSIKKMTRKGGKGASRE